MSATPNIRVERPGLIHLLPAFYLMLVAWIVFYLEWRSGSSWSSWGLYPRTLNGLIGVVTMPVLHADMTHLINNSIPLIILGSVLRYFYKELFWRVIGVTWILTGLITWIMAREAFHIGASGLVYALASFLFFSGAFRLHRPLMAVSFFVVFAYGSMVWGVLPIEPTISWEGHLGGAISGLLVAVLFRKVGPQAPPKPLEVLDQTTESDVYLEQQAMQFPSPDAYGAKYWEEHAHQTQPVRIVYTFNPIKKAPPTEGLSEEASQKDQ